MLVYPPEKIEISDQELDAEIELKLAHKGARVSRARRLEHARRGRARGARRCCSGRSPLALPRKAVGEIDRDGKFVVGTLLPGALRDLGARRLAHSPDHQRPREVEIPIDPGATVDLAETITVRPQAEE
jgi:hypothetical protein